MIDGWMDGPVNEWVGNLDDGMTDGWMTKQIDGLIDE